MPFLKITNLFNQSTKDSAGNAKRSAGFSESFYYDAATETEAFRLDWDRLCKKRAALLAANVTMVGERFQTVLPTGASRSFDTVYPPTLSVGNDLPGIAMQFTARSTNSANQRSIILRGLPDERTVTGEYVAGSTYDAALISYFTELKAKWGFLALDRTVLPVKLISINEDGLAVTVGAHGFAIGDQINIMSSVNQFGKKISQLAVVVTVPSASTFTIFLPRQTIDAPPTTFLPLTKGKVRKIVTVFRSFEISNEEIKAPKIIHRETGRPFHQFRGRRTGSR